MVQANDERWRANLGVARDAGQVETKASSIAWRALVGGWAGDAIDKAARGNRATATGRDYVL